MLTPKVIRFRGSWEVLAEGAHSSLFFSLIFFFVVVLDFEKCSFLYIFTCSRLPDQRCLCPYQTVAGAPCLLEGCGFLSSEAFRSVKGRGGNVVRHLCNNSFELEIQWNVSCRLVLFHPPFNGFLLIHISEKLCSWTINWFLFVLYFFFFQHVRRTDAGLLRENGAETWPTTSSLLQLLEANFN